VVSPAARREAVGLLRDQGLSQRRSLTICRLSRTVLCYLPRVRDDTALRSRMKELAQRYPRYGHPLLHSLLKREGLVVNRKRSYRIYREEQLQVRRRKRRKRPLARVAAVLPAAANQRWSMDFVSDQLAGGRRIRVLNVIDDFTRECLGQLVDTSIGGQRAVRLLEEIAQRQGAPRRIVCDNGPEFTSIAMFSWAAQRSIELCFIEPGKPVQNCFVESFNGRFRDGCLSQQWFIDLDDARGKIEDWRVHYNTERPHSSLDYLPPAHFRRSCEAGGGEQEVQSKEEARGRKEEIKAA
jgi:putative transposase